MSGLETLCVVASAVIVGLVMAAVCAFGLAFLLHYARETVRDVSSWLKGRRDRWAAGHLYRMVRKGRLGI
jgi:hypothetical protein